MKQMLCTSVFLFSAGYLCAAQGATMTVEDHLKIMENFTTKERQMSSQIQQLRAKIEELNINHGKRLTDKNILCEEQEAALQRFEVAAQRERAINKGLSEFRYKDLAERMQQTQQLEKGLESLQSQNNMLLAQHAQLTHDHTAAQATIAQNQLTVANLEQQNSALRVTHKSALEHMRTLNRHLGWISFAQHCCLFFPCIGLTFLLIKKPTFFASTNNGLSLSLASATLALVSAGLYGLNDYLTKRHQRSYPATS